MVKNNEVMTSLRWSFVTAMHNKGLVQGLPFSPILIILMRYVCPYVSTSVRPHVCAVWRWRGGK